MCYLIVINPNKKLNSQSNIKLKITLYTLFKKILNTFFTCNLDYFTLSFLINLIEDLHDLNYIKISEGKGFT